LLALAEAALTRAGGDAQREIERLDALAVVAWYGEGRPEEARVVYERIRAMVEPPCAALEAQARADDPRCFRLIDLDGSVAGVLLDTGHPAEAIPIYERVRAARARTQGPDALMVAIYMMNEGEALSLAGRPAEALALLRQVVAIEERAGRAVNMDFIHHRMADALRRLRRFEEALAEDRASLAIFAESHEEESAAFATALTGLGEDLVALGRAGEAQGPLERALTLREQRPLGAADLASTRFALAKALWESGRDRERARSLAARAGETFRAAFARHGGFRATLDEIDRWVAAHPGRKD
jgi:tetratricopeptide (TPR) repeat protein